MYAILEILALFVGILLTIGIVLFITLMTLYFFSK